MQKEKATPLLGAPLLSAAFCMCAVLVFPIAVDTSESYSFVRMWPKVRCGWHLSFARDVAVDSSGNVYVAQQWMVKKFNSSGTFLGWWGKDDQGDAGWHDAGSDFPYASAGFGDGEFGGHGSESPSGLAVDSTGHLYVADTENCRIQKFDCSGTFLGWWGKDDQDSAGWHNPGSGLVGTPGHGDSEFLLPEGVAVDSIGHVYVADTGNCRIQEFDSSGTFLGWWGRDGQGDTGWHDPGQQRPPAAGSGDGGFCSPKGIAVDSSGMVFVADFDNFRIQKFDSWGAFVGWWGTDDQGDTGWHGPGSNRRGYPGNGDGGFSSPIGVAVDQSGDILVADELQDRIQEFDPVGTFLGWWGKDDQGEAGWHEPGSGRTGVHGHLDGEFRSPKGVAVAPSGDVYVADWLNRRVQKFDSSGSFLEKWRADGKGDGEFYGVSHIALDSRGNVYAADGANHRIQKFDSLGTFLGWWGKDDQGDAGWHDPGSGRAGASGNGDGEFQNPFGIAIDTMEHVYVADRGNHRIQKFDSSGTFLGWWGKDDHGDAGWHDPGSGRVGASGNGNGAFDSSADIGVDSSGHVYVTDDGNHRVQKFDSSGTFLGWWGKDDQGDAGWHDPGTGRIGADGNGDGEFRCPYGIAVEPSGIVFVADTVNDRVQVFDSSGTLFGWWGKDDQRFTGWHEPGSGRSPSLGNGDGEFSNPKDVGIDAWGSVFVADRFRIQNFSSTWSFLGWWGKDDQGYTGWHDPGTGRFAAPGLDPGEFLSDWGIVVAPMGNVFVADDCRIQVFRPDRSVTVNTIEHGRPTVEWRSRPEHSYRVWVAADLPDWISASGVLPGSEIGTNFWMDDGLHGLGEPSAAPRRFYRIQLVPQR